MPSSTSSSNLRLPRLKWREVLRGALAMLLAAVCAMEAGLALRGIRPNPAESMRAWVQQRARADAVGPRALALVGNSRILVDTDLQVLRGRTHFEPIQLGIEGSPFMPVLQGLAADPAFHGSVLVDMDFPTLTSHTLDNTAAGYESYFQVHRDDSFSYLEMENRLGDLLHAGLRSYADGSRPLTALWTRLIHRPDPVQYLKMLPDRSVLADYSKTPMPGLYYFRAWRNLTGDSHLPPGITIGQAAALFESDIAKLRPADDSSMAGLLASLRTAVGAIQAKGGQVYFVVFPRSGYMRETDDRRFPRAQFWDRIAALPAVSVNFEDVPLLKSLNCPDGSHLDYHQRPVFTYVLIQALDLQNAR